ncbi:MAG: hypothetical protein J6K42_00405 [Clostridia bacterium]|nr:hypothetical protein [Clostridia bacterium]
MWIIFSKKKEEINSTQSWLQLNKILTNGIIKIEDKYIKIIKVIPINFSLKSELEKEAILNSYKLFLKTFNFDLQILIQSKKEDLSKHISCVESQKNNENKKIQNISQNYIDYILELNKKKKSSTKNFYIIIESNNINKEMENFEEIACDELNEKYLKIKDCLSRCGNMIINITEKEEIKDILFSFLNSQKFIFE